MKNIYHEYWLPLCLTYHNLTITIKNYMNVDIHGSVLFEEAFSAYFFSSKSRYSLKWSIWRDVQRLFRYFKEQISIEVISLKRRAASIRFLQRADVH